MEFTTKQIAELLGVSKPTVQKAIKELAIQPERRENNNRAYYSYGNTVSIIKRIRPNYDDSLLIELVGKPQNDTAKPQNEPQNTAKPQNFAENSDEKIAKPQTNEELEFLKRALHVIETQLAEKDKQLAVKDKQIQDLSDRLAEAMQLTKGQQYIAAADKTTELLEADNKRQQQQDEQPIVSNEDEVVITSSSDEKIVDAEVIESSSSDQEITAAEPKEEKKSFWQRLFGF